MKKSLLLLCLLCNFAFGQQVVTTYYDWQKTRKKEVYQTDANGTRNGNYKNFDEQGALRNEGTFKFGKQNGVFIEYAKFPNYAGTMQVKTKETYVDGLREGAAVYYNYDEDLKVYELQKGNYKQDKEEGDWIVISPFNRVVTAEDCNYIKSVPAFKGSMGIKEIVTYKEGEKIKKIGGNQEIYYYPSNKLYRKVAIDNTTFTGIDVYYYPDGKIWSKTVVENDKRVSVETFYFNGKIKTKELMNPYSYEGYNPDGTPDKDMIRAAEMEKRNAENRKKSTEELTKAIEVANLYGSMGLLDEAIDNLQKQINRTDELLTGTNELKTAKETLDTIKKQNADYKLLVESVKANYDTYLKTFQGDRFVNEHNMYDYPYPKGKNSYEKTQPILMTDLELVKSANSMTEKQKIGKRINNNLEKLQQIAETDWPELNKKLKKANNAEEVKDIIGLE